VKVDIGVVAMEECENRSLELPCEIEGSRTAQQMAHHRVDRSAAPQDCRGDRGGDFRPRQAVDILVREHLDSRFCGEPGSVRAGFRKISRKGAAHHYSAEVRAETDDRTPQCRMTVGVERITRDVQYRRHGAGLGPRTHFRDRAERSTAD
jgi:hypothetical protein